MGDFPHRMLPEKDSTVLVISGRDMVISRTNIASARLELIFNVITQTTLACLESSRAL